MAKPTFSIIVPVYNVEKYLNQCVDSVLNQTYQDFELILVDDGAIDNSGKLCDDFARKDQRVKVIHKQNGGQTSARKEGAMVATGDYVTCLDADDWLSSDYLEKFYTVVKEYAPDVICCGHYNCFNEERVEKKLPDEFGYYDKEKIVQKIYPKLIQSKDASYFSPSVWAKAYKRDLYLENQLKIDDRIRIGEDGALVISIMSKAKDLFILSDCLYNYRLTNQSVTGTKKPFLWDGPKLIAEHIKSTLDINAYDFTEQYYRKVTHELFSVVVSRFYQDKPYKEIKREILENLKEPIYLESIEKSVFNGSLKAKFMKTALSKKLILLIKIYANIK